MYEQIDSHAKSIQKRTRFRNDKRKIQIRRVNDRNRSVIHSWKVKFLSGITYDPQIDYASDPVTCIGTMTHKCTHCHALKWKDEAPGMCCSNGKVVLPPFEPLPELLSSLLLDHHPYHQHFMNNIRQYNGCFQMTSFGAERIFEGGFMPTFKIQGQVYHLVGSLLPERENDEKFLQIYFVGEDEREADLRCNNFPNIKKGLVKQLQHMLHEVNVYVKEFKVAFDNITTPSQNFKVIIHADRTPANAHKGRYNAPSVNEVALLMVGQEFTKRDIIIESHDEKLHRISEIHRSYDALQYPLLFCRGENGYSVDIPHFDPKTKMFVTKSVSAAEFYSHRLMIREGEDNHILHFRSLLSQFLVDMYAKIETERLNYIKFHQKKLRAEEYVHLQDAVRRQDADASQLGQMVILPSSFTGGPRYMHERIQDALTYVRHGGCPDLFITFTCNPQWDEIKENLFRGQRSYDRHDIIARVFRLKIKKMMDLFVKSKIYGDVKYRMYSVEWQKRGLPHIHLLLWLMQRINPDMIDKFVCCEIPDPEKDPVLYDIVKSTMIHGPCGTINPNAPCMKDGKCTKGYPKPFVKETQTGEDGYPLYRRRSPVDGGFTVEIKGLQLDNRWVVPYPPILLKIFKAHINIEICTSVKSIKYVCKYINKGTDQAAFVIHNERNEVLFYQSGRYISSSEGTWRTLGFPIHERYPTVFHLAVHLENGQRIYFDSDNILEKVNNPPKTTLTAFFHLCTKDNFAKTLLYCEVPSYYRWLDNKFVRRKNGTDVNGWPGVKKDDALGRVYTIHPNNAECYYLRLLLHEVRGPTSFSDLKTFNDILYPTYQAACRIRGLLEDDQHCDVTLQEGVLCDSPTRLRNLFAVILIFCHPSDPILLWEKYKDSFSEDITRRMARNISNTADYMNDVYNECLIIIENTILDLAGKRLQDFGLPSPKTPDAVINRDYLRETNYNVLTLRRFVQENKVRLTPEQSLIYEVIIQSVDSHSGQFFFLDAPGGTGKTFLLNLLLAEIRSNHGIALAAASSGIAATLLEGGKTAHSAFKLPLNLNNVENPLCYISKQSDLAAVFRECKLIVWDESTMAHKGAFEALDRSLRDIRNNNNVMGGVTVLLAGDFRQTLPVVPRGTRADEIKACLKKSYLWRYIQNLSLSINMRVHLNGDENAGRFSELLLRIGNGECAESDGKMELTVDLCTVVTNLEGLTNAVYPALSHLREKSSYWLCERAILTPTNDKAAEINSILLQKFEAVQIEYKSIDSVIEMDDAVQYPVEFLNSLNLPGFPPHELILKIGTPIMLLRNLSPPKLCNGTRLQIIVLHKNLIEAIILTGCGRGESVFIPRIPLITTDYVINFRRLQFPIKVCFAMTINKAQGQTLRVAGIDLRDSCFSHGQFYVACSRVSSSNSLFILAPQGNTTNVVYKEIL